MSTSNTPGRTVDPGLVGTTPPLDQDLHCPRCNYNLRMLTASRCPECGLVFDRDELLAAAASSANCPIFEYQWRKRPMRSYIRTLGLALWPWSCWRVIRIEYEPRVGPLIVFLMTTLLLTQVAKIALVPIENRLVECARGVGQNWKNTLWEIRPFLSPAYGYQVLLTLITPLVIVALSIAVYRITFVRYRIRWHHLIRIAMLAGAGWIALSFLMNQLISAVVLVHWFRAGGPPAFRTLSFVLPLQVWLPFGLLLISVSLGFGRYLRLRRAWIAATASLLVTTIALVVLHITLLVASGRRALGDGLNPLDEWLPGLKWLCLKLLSL